MREQIQLTITIPEDLAGMRLDQALAKLLTDYSRTQIQEWIKQEAITINKQPAKPRIIVFGREVIEINASPKEQPQWEAQAIQLNIIYEDEALIVVNKPVGMVVHPAAGNSANTLLNALLNHEPTLAELPRAGIVHRLDKDTSGLLVIAKTSKALLNLTRQLKARSIKRIYQAIVMGVLTSGGTVDAPIGRHFKVRKRMAIQEDGKPAVTHFRIMEKYRAHTRLKVQLETGRTHQIRVHMAHIHHPILGDQTYARLQLPKGASPQLITELKQFKRQALHAFELGLEHPTSKLFMNWEAPLPEDMEHLIAVLREDTK